MAKVYFVTSESGSSSGGTTSTITNTVPTSPTSSEKDEQGNGTGYMVLGTLPSGWTRIDLQVNTKTSIGTAKSVLPANFTKSGSDTICDIDTGVDAFFVTIKAATGAPSPAPAYTTTTAKVSNLRLTLTSSRQLKCQTYIASGNINTQYTVEPITNDPSTTVTIVLTIFS